MPLALDLQLECAKDCEHGQFGISMFYQQTFDYFICLAMPAHETHTPSQRSRSPADRYHHVRSRSPHSRHHHSVSHKHKRSKPSALMQLPFQALKLHKHDFEALKPMFELYLDIQKQKVLEELSNDEVQGRWKSFVGKWYITTFLTTPSYRF